MRKILTLSLLLACTYFPTMLFAKISEEKVAADESSDVLGKKLAMAIMTTTPWGDEYDEQLNELYDAILEARETINSLDNISPKTIEMLSSALTAIEDVYKELKNGKTLIKPTTASQAGELYQTFKFHAKLLTKEKKKLESKTKNKRSRKLQNNLVTSLQACELFIERLQFKLQKLKKALLISQKAQENKYEETVKQLRHKEEEIEKFKEIIKKKESGQDLGQNS